MVESEDIERWSDVQSQTQFPFSAQLGHFDRYFCSPGYFSGHNSYISLVVNLQLWLHFKVRCFKKQHYPVWHITRIWRKKLSSSNISTHLVVVFMVVPCNLPFLCPVSFSERGTNHAGRYPGHPLRAGQGSLLFQAAG